MKESTSKEKVLKKVREALVNAMPPPFQGVDLESPVLKQQDAAYGEEAFASALSEAGAYFVFCQDVREMVQGIQTLLARKSVKKLYCREAFLTVLLRELGVTYHKEVAKAPSCDAAITSCEALVARHGSILFSSRQDSGRKAIISAPLHIVVATSQQLVGDISDALRFVGEMYGGKIPSMLSFVTGPSRTADIEKTLVHGAHGPRELYLFMLDAAAEQEGEVE